VARTPSKEAHFKVLRSALQLIAERGVEGTSMDAIAAASGVSKATVYKHWANKDELLIDVIRHQSACYPMFESGHPREDMVDLLRHLAQKVKSEDLARIWPMIISYAMSNPEFGKALQQHVFMPRRDLVLRLLKEGEAKAGLRADIDPEFAMDMLIGPIMHRRFVDDGHVPLDMPERVVDFFWKVFGRKEN
jgi:AcrR family transcriptional regulator